MASVFLVLDKLGNRYPSCFRYLVCCRGVCGMVFLLGVKKPTVLVGYELNSPSGGLGGGGGLPWKMWSTSSRFQ